MMILKIGNMSYSVPCFTDHSPCKIKNAKWVSFNLQEDGTMKMEDWLPKNPQQTESGV